MAENGSTWGPQRPPLLCELSHPVLLPDALVLGHEVHREGALVELPGPTLVTLPLGGGEPVEIDAPQSDT